MALTLHALKSLFQKRTKMSFEQKKKCSSFALFGILKQGLDPASTNVKIQGKFTLKGNLQVFIEEEIAHVEFLVNLHVEFYCSK